MRFVLIGSGALLAATLLLAAIAWLALRVAHRRPRRFWRRTLVVHLVLVPIHLFLTVPGLLGWFGSRMARTRGDESRYSGPLLGPDGNWVQQSRESLAAGGAPAANLARVPPIHLTARDGVALRAFVVPPRHHPARFAAVLAHGLFRGSLELEPIGRMLRELGGEVMLLELRNHGGSGRAAATFGQDEALDVIAAVNWLRARPEHGERKVILFGVSLGTAAVGMATRQLDSLGGLVLDAPIDAIERTAERMFALAPRPGHRGVSFPQPFRWLILESLQIWSGVRFRDIQPGQALRSLPADVPVLLVGGGQDQRVPPGDVRLLFDELPTAPQRKLLWIHPTAFHGRVWTDDAAGYRARLAEFVALLR